MFDTTSDSFGTLLKHFRKRQHLTQQQIAEALGLHRNTIGRWEECSFLPGSKTLILELARCLHLTVSEARQLLDTSLLVPKPIWSVPHPRNPFFTGRKDLLALLHTHLAPVNPLLSRNHMCCTGWEGSAKRNWLWNMLIAMRWSIKLFSGSAPKLLKKSMSAKIVDL